MRSYEREIWIGAWDFTYDSYMYMYLSVWAAMAQTRFLRSPAWVFIWSCMRQVHVSCINVKHMSVESWSTLYHKLLTSFSRKMRIKILLYSVFILFSFSFQKSMGFSATIASCNFKLINKRSEQGTVVLISKKCMYLSLWYSMTLSEYVRYSCQD